MRVERIERPPAQPRTDHAAYLVAQIREAIQHADQADAVDVSQNRRRQGDAARPDDAADRGCGIKLPVRAHHDQCKEPQPSHQIDRRQDVAALDLVRHAAQHQRAENGDQTNQPDTQRTRGGVKAMVHQHRHAVRAQQVHAVATGEQPQRHLPERQRAQGIAHVGRGAAGGGLGGRLVVDDLMRQQVSVFGRGVAHDEERDRHGQQGEQHRKGQQCFLPAHGFDRECQRGRHQGDACHRSGRQEEQRHAAPASEPAADDGGQRHGAGDRQADRQRHAE
ncbi:hypothetical protein G6F57_014708 [Rhizopus arrhizus]|nr:hypothetical protein G6F57_014708 [Rhizopus arrhizus]